MNSTKLKDLSLWWAAGLPAAMFALTLYAYFTSPELMMLLIRRDEHPDGGGIAENGTILVLLPGIVAGLTVLWSYRNRLPLWLGGWVLGWTLACIYFAGEEASWGQHYLHWGTPETIVTVNDQRETNLHNISHWLDQKPRTLVELWAVLAGLFLPLWWRLRRIPPFGARAWRDWFWPTLIGAPAVAIFLVTHVYAVIVKKNGWPGWYTLGSNELREFYLAVFLSGYLLSLWYRLRQTA
jgi:hypothetical protein